MASEWTAAGIGIVSFVVHVLWFQEADHQAEVLSGFGGALTVLGILVAAQPYIRKGVRQAGREQAGLTEPMGDQKRPEDEPAEIEGIRHVIKERIVGVLLVAIGSLLNGYGPALGSALRLRGS